MHAWEHVVRIPFQIGNGANQRGSVHRGNQTPARKSLSAIDDRAIELEIGCGDRFVLGPGDLHLAVRSRDG